MAALSNRMDGIKDETSLPNHTTAVFFPYCTVAVFILKANEDTWRGSCKGTGFKRERKKIFQMFVFDMGLFAETISWRTGLRSCRLFLFALHILHPLSHFGLCSLTCAWLRWEVAVWNHSLTCVRQVTRIEAQRMLLVAKLSIKKKIHK